MSVIDSIIQRKAGLASVYEEAGVAEAGTTGHSQVEGGIRGHSLGDTYPFRVVIFGDGCAGVERNGTPGTGPVFSRHGAHDIARLCRKLYDNGDLHRISQLVGPSQRGGLVG